MHTLTFKCRAFLKTALLTTLVLPFISCGPAREYDSLEQETLKVISPAQLQHWGTNLLAQYSPTAQTSRITIKELGTNFPQQLLSVAPSIGPIVTIYALENTNSPTCVRIWWGSGALGHSGFEIGRSNYYRSGKQLTNGVFFFKT